MVTKQKKMKNSLVKMVLCICALTIVSCAQSHNGATSSAAKGKKIVKAQDDVEIICYGEGTTRDDAIKSALRFGIEQTHGVFVSSNTSILNDVMVRDEISTIASGNIKGYDIISATEIGNKWRVTLKSIVSTGHLVSYVQSHGGKTELAGGVFAMNMKMQELNEKAEREALANMFKLLGEIEPNMYDYSIVAEEPVRKGSEYEVPVVVKCFLNENIMAYSEIFNRTMSALSIPADEIIQRTKNNLPVFPIVVMDGPADEPFRSVETVTHPTAPTRVYRICANDTLLHIEPERPDINRYCKRGGDNYTAFQRIIEESQGDPIRLKNIIETIIESNRIVFEYKMKYQPFDGYPRKPITDPQYIQNASKKVLEYSRMTGYKFSRIYDVFFVRTDTFEDLINELPNSSTNISFDDGTGKGRAKYSNRTLWCSTAKLLLVTRAMPGDLVFRRYYTLSYRSLEDISKVKQIKVVRDNKPQK